MKGLKRLAVPVAFAFTLLVAVPVGPVCARIHPALRATASRIKAPFACCRGALTRVPAAEAIPLRFHDRSIPRRFDGATLSLWSVPHPLADRQCVATGLRCRVFLVTQRLRL